MRRYGPIVGYYVGSTPIVLVADFDVLKDICKLDSTRHRSYQTNLHIVARFSYKYV
jgi:pyoverdine/dityrosine biosynthesis protein Dit1